LPTIHGGVKRKEFILTAARNVKRKEGTCLVGGFYPSEKYELVNGKDDIPYIIENNPFMCETL
jgi:hypothetical protein